VGRGLALRRGERALDCGDLLAHPGLVNAHDHLGLDLLPPLGTPPYSSFYRWAEEIYRPHASPVRETLALPLAHRLRWGGLRNLVSGATTVVHHDPWHRSLRGSRRSPFPVYVLERYSWAHSLGFGGDVGRAYRRSRHGPFVIHVAEGTDERAGAEIDRLDEIDALGARTVLVHAIAASEDQIELLRQRRASVVWCPSSNLHLYGATAPIGAMRGRVPVALGTDSTLSGSATLFDEMRAAQETGLADAAEIRHMVTVEGARIFGLEELGTGRLDEGCRADLLLLPDDGRRVEDILLAATPATLALVTVAGRPHLAATDLAAELQLGEANLRLDGRATWVLGSPQSLRRRIERRGGAAVTSGPLWRRLGAI